MMLRVAACALVVGIIGGLVSCGDDSAAPGPAAGTGPKIGLIVTGSTSDGGWNQLASDSMNRLAKLNNAEIMLRQQVSKDAAADAIRQLDAKGCTLVIAHGYEYLEPVKELTDPSKPNAVKVKIAVSGGDVNSPNFQSLYYDLSGASYQLGVIAAKVSKSGKLGFIGGAPFPTVTAMERGFEAGAKSVNPAVTVAAQYTGWDDPSKAKKQAEAFMEQGVDVIMQNVDAASRGVFEAIKEHNSKTPDAPKFLAYTFGANSDQNGNPVCAEYTLASAVIRMDKAFDRALRQVKDAEFKGGVVKEDIASGVSVAVINPILVGNVIDRDTVKLVQDIGKKLAEGEIKVPDEKK